MKNIKTILIVLAVIALYISQSCANTTAPPSGGPKDTIPPVLRHTIPDSNSINFPLDGGRVELQFDEYVVLKEPHKHIYISPPLKKKIESKIRGKRVIVTFPVALNKETTYTLNFGNSIEDNNENNPFPAYVMTFSTGTNIDSMMITGNVVDAESLIPVEGATIALYRDPTDTSIYKTLPDAIGKTDKWGYFSIRNIKDVPYTVYAFTDGNSNYLYNPENEKIAFLDTLFKPTIVMKKGIEELKVVGEKDTTEALARRAQIDLYLFKEDSDIQMIKDYKRLSKRMSYIKFNAPQVEIKSIKVGNIDSTKILRQFNLTKDSLVLWLTDPIMKIPDTLSLSINYMKSDSTGRLNLFDEKLKLVAPRERAKDKREQSEDRNKRKNLLEFKIETSAQTVQRDGFKLEFPAPLIEIRDSLISMTAISAKGAKSNFQYKIVKDSIENRIYNIIPMEEMKSGYDYLLTINKNSFKDVWGNTNDSTDQKSSLPTDEKLSNLILEMQNVKGTYVVELTGQTRDRVLEKYKINKDTKLTFNYLSAGKYTIIVFRDINGNGILDTGNLKEKKQPEKVRLYKLSDGSSYIEIKESSTVEQSIDLSKMFEQ